jgi:hypothetical protein
MLEFEQRWVPPRGTAQRVPSGVHRWCPRGDTVHTHTPVGRCSSDPVATRPHPGHVRAIGQTGRESWTLSRVDMSEVPTTRPRRSSDDVAVPWSPAHDPLAAPGPRGTAAETSGPGPSRSVGRLGRSRREAPLLGTFRVSSAGLCGMLPRAPCPASQRRKLWLDQPGARRALAVPPRGSSDASATTTSSRFSPELSGRSRRRLSAAA